MGRMLYSFFTATFYPLTGLLIPSKVDILHAVKNGLFTHALSCITIILLDSIDDEDEVLLVLAEELPNLSPFLGGSEYISRLLVPLENLAAIEDATVRDKVRKKKNLSNHGSGVVLILTNGTRLWIR